MIRDEILKAIEARAKVIIDYGSYQKEFMLGDINNEITTVMRERTQFMEDAELGRAVKRALEKDFELFEDLYCPNDGLEFKQMIHDTKGLLDWYKKEGGVNDNDKAINHFQIK